MKANRLVERLNEILETMKVEPPVPPHASVARVRIPSPRPPRYKLSYPIPAENPVAAPEVKAELRLCGRQAGWLAAGVPRADPQFERASRLTAAAARLLSDRLSELNLRPVGFPRSPVDSPHKIVFATGEGQASPDAPAEVQPLRQPLFLNGRVVGCLRAAADPQFSGLLESVAVILADRLEVLDLQARLDEAEAGTAALRARLQHLTGT